MRFKVVAIELHQHVPAKALRNRRHPVERRPALLIRHLEEKQIRQLLDVIAIRQPVIPQDVAVVPELLNNLRGGHDLSNCPLNICAFGSRQVSRELDEQEVKTDLHE